MLQFQQNEFDSEHDRSFYLCSDLLSVASELGIDTGLSVYNEMELEQLQSVQGMLEAAIEAEYEKKKDDLRRMKRCPQGYLWDAEGTGWRCQGGSHYCDAVQIKQFME